MAKRKWFQRVLSTVLAVAMACSALPGTVAGAPYRPPTQNVPAIEELRSTKVGDYVSKIPTPQDSPVINKNYDRSYDNYEIKGDSGLIHPGILMNREELNIMRDMVWIGAEPWASRFAELQKSPYASLNYRPDGPFEYIDADRETYSLTRASTAVYELALMWYITGEKAYADKSIGIIMDWADTLVRDNKRDHLRMGTSTHKFCIAAEIFRYTPSSGWTEENTRKFSAYLDQINPAFDKAYQYLNQGGYGLMAFMGKQIFQDNAAGYADAVERIAYNKNHGWKGGNSVNFSLSAMVFNNGSFVEMGRDQEHAWDDLGFMSMVVKTTYVQGTKVDEKGNIVSVGGKDLYEYDNQKVLKAAAYWQRYCMGEEPVYVPYKNAWGQKAEFGSLSNVYRGQTLMWSPSLYYHYLYTKGYKAENKRTIAEPGGTDPTEDPYSTYGDAYKYIGVGADLSVPTYVRGTNVDFPDFQDLTFTPLAAIYDDALKGSPQTESEGATDNCPGYNRYLGNDFSGTGNGERDAESKSDGRNGGVITEPATDEEGSAHFITSDFQNGEWVAYNVDFEKDFGGDVDTLVYTYGTNASNNPKLKIYVGEQKEKPAQADYDAAVAAGAVGTLELGPTGGYYSFKSFSGKMDNASKLTGKKTVYFYGHGSNNTYNFHGDCLWFKFVDSQASEVNTGAGADLKEKATVKGDGLELADQGYAGWKNMDFDSGFSGITLDIRADAAGSLALYVDGPGEAEGGRLVQTYELAAGTDKPLRFSQEDQKAITGRHAVYLVYSGQGLTLNSVQFAKAAVSVKSFEDHPADSYTAILRGDAQKTADHGLVLDGKSRAYASYMNVPFLDGADTLAVRVKSTGKNRLNFDLVTTDPSVAGTIGKNGDLAYFDLPDTAGLSEDGFVTLYFDLKKTGKNTLTNNQYVGMGAEGNGTVEVGYFRLNPENTAPELALYENGSGEAAGREIYTSAGTQKSYNAAADDADGDTVSVSVYGDIPSGFSYAADKKTLTIAQNVAAGEYTVRFLVTDGTVNSIETFTFHLQTDREAVQKIIDDSGVEKYLLTYYLYRKEKYDAYMSAKNTALAGPTAENIQKLEAAIKDCKENTPVYSKVKFEWRLANSGQTGSLDMYLDTTDNQNAEQRIASTGDLNRVDDKVAVTDWIPFKDKEGKPRKITGNHTLSVWLNSGATRLVSFTLANEDGTAQKTIDAISFSGSGNTANLCINQLDNDNSKLASFPHEVRGATTWLTYTWPVYDDLSGLKFEGNSKAWPLRGKNGPGFDFEVTPGILEDIEKAEGKLAGESLYTQESCAALRTAYDAAKDAVDNYASYDGSGLTVEKALALEKSLEEALAGLQTKPADAPAVTVKEDDSCEDVVFDATGNSDPNGSFKSQNPTFAAEAGKKISFMLQVDERIKNPRVTVKQFGYRGSARTSAEELAMVEPELSADDVTVEGTDNTNTFKVQWTGKAPGNYRAVFTVESDTETADQAVEMICKNPTDRADWKPQYVRMRFAGFRNNEEKKAELYLVEKDGATDDAHKIATLTSMWDMDAQYALTDWVEIKWPDGYDATQNQLAVKVVSRDTHVDFFEFATESYKKLHEDSCQNYPLASAGVMRIEAEHYDWNKATGFDAVDFNGRYGWENGSPGKGAGAITTSAKENEVKYNNVVFASETPGDVSATEPPTCTAQQPYMMKDTTQKLESTDSQVSWLSTNPAVLTVDGNGTASAEAAGEASVYALNVAKASEPVLIRVADKAYLDSLVEMYDEYIKDNEAGYTTESWRAMQAAYDAAKKAQGSDEAENVYKASTGLWDAVSGRVPAARMYALETYISLAESLKEGEYTPETWQALCGALEKAKKCTKDNAQAEINQAATELQEALYSLEVVYAEETDKSALNETAAQAEKLLAAGQQQYTDESWAEFTEALEQAKAILAETPTTKVRIQMAAEILGQAMARLEKKVDYTKLEELYARYKDLKGDAYTAESFQIFTKARNEAKALLDGRKGTQEQVDKALAALQSAVAGLRQKPASDGSQSQTVTVVYQAGAGGRIQGQTTQTIPKGGSTSEVKAVADSGYKFVKWSDGRTDASRRDTNVQAGKTVTAQFAKNSAKKVSKVTLNKKKLTLGVKETFTLKATVKPSSAKNKKVTWKSSKKSVATVNSKGKVTAKKTGKATITATVDGKRATCQIVVKKAPQKITLNAKSKKLKKGKTFQIKVKFPKNTASNKITYKSSKKSVATVSSSGKVKAVKKGTATITVRTFNKKTAKIKITVK